MFNKAQNFPEQLLIYGFGAGLVRGLAFLLLPLYTRALTPEDYGILAVANLVIALLSIILPLSLHSALTSFFFDLPPHVSASAYISTLWFALVLSGVSGCLLLEWLGPSITPLIFRNVPFDPYLRLAIWASFGATFNLIPLALFQVQGQSQRYVLLNMATAVITTMAIIIFVVVFQQGALGYMRGVLAANSIMAVLFSGFIWRTLQWRIDFSILRRALNFSLPLVPHVFAAWVLELADRVILEQYVTLTDLGLYAVGYQLSNLLVLLVAAFAQAWPPYLFRRVAESGDAAQPELARLITYFATILLWVGLGLILSVKGILILMTAAAYHAAYTITFWVLLGRVLHSLHYVPVNFLLLKKRTQIIPIATIISAAVNIGLNLWLIPLYGTLAAAWATIGAYGVLLILMWAFAQQVYRFPYEYLRLTKLVLVVLGCWGVGQLWHSSNIWLEMVGRSVWCLTLPLWLWVVGFFTPEEKHLVHVWWQRFLLNTIK